MKSNAVQKNKTSMKSFPKHLLTPAEKALFKKLNTPEKIQDYIITLPTNNTDSVQSVRRSFNKQKMHCLEGAFFAAAVLWFHGDEPLLLDLRTTSDDLDHVIALFKRDDLWGAISATHHSVLRYRDPIYKNIRELALTYFHEYFLNSGVKTMRAYSKKPFSLLLYGDLWLFDEEELYDIGAALDDAPHEPIAPPKTIRKLRKADKIERIAADLTK
ncbi:MAG: hypothetical protein KBB70_01045 [Candidatus Pacebacteria bacterium]|jgi:hypothetical protein|nr:hypothetical protein [Candidatus Paceibacterota bacterium]